MKRMLRAARDYFSGPRDKDWWLERVGAVLLLIGSAVFATTITMVNYGHLMPVDTFVTIVGIGIATGAVGTCMLAVTTTLHFREHVSAITQNDS